jgi:hypothetical protein
MRRWLSSSPSDSCGALAIVYLVAGRNVAPCVAAHFLINAFIEPGLVLAAVRGEMGRLRTATP